MGNVTTTFDVKGGAGNQFVQDLNITLSTSYASGGDAITARQCGMGFVNSCIIMHATTSIALTVSSTTVPLGASFKVLAFSADVEVNATTDLSGTTARARVEGF